MNVSIEDALDSITTSLDGDYDFDLLGWWAGIVEEDDKGNAFGRLVFDNNEGLVLTFEVRQVSNA